MTTKLWAYLSRWTFICCVTHMLLFCNLSPNTYSRVYFPSEVTCGVVTKMAPSNLCFLRFSSTAKCSSDVPGGVSTSRTSSSPHATSDTNWPIKAARQENKTWNICWAEIIKTCGWGLCCLWKLHKWRRAYLFSWDPSTPLLHLGPPAESRWTWGRGSSGHQCTLAPIPSHTGAHQADPHWACGGYWAHTSQHPGYQPEAHLFLKFLIKSIWTFIWKVVTKTVFRQGKENWLKLWICGEYIAIYSFSFL